MIDDLVAVYVAWWRALCRWWVRLEAWFSRPVTNPRPVLSRAPQPKRAAVDPDKRCPKHYQGVDTVPIGDLIARLKAEGANVGRLAHIVDGETTTEMHNPFLFCGADGGLIAHLHPAPDVFWPHSGDLAAVEDEAVTA